LSALWVCGSPADLLRIDVVHNEGAMASPYNAFLSYSHAADGRLAPALQRGIQRLGKSWFQRTAVRVFRDKTNLSVSPGLWSAIQSSLEQSEYLLLMASVQSAASPWVQKELEWWLEHRSVAKLLIIVTDGQVAWDARKGDFDWERTTCLPPLLRGHFQDEPHYLDLRWARGRKILTLHNQEFRAAVLTLAAPLHGKRMEELDSEDIRQQRRFLRIAISVIMVIGILAVAGIVEQRRAKDESAIAQSRRMAARSVVLLERKDIDEAIVFAVFAWRLSHTDEALSVLRRVASASVEVATILGQHTGNVTTIAFGPTRDEGTVLATGGDDGLIMLWRVPDGRPIESPIASGQSSVHGIQFSEDGRYLLSRGVGPKTEQDHGHASLVLYDLSSKTRMQVPTEFLFRKTYLLGPDEASLSPDGRRVALMSDNHIAVWDAASGTIRQKIAPRDLHTVCLQFATNSRLLWVSSYGTGVTLTIWDLETNRTQVGPPVKLPDIDPVDETDVTASCTKDASRVAVWGGKEGPPSLYLRGNNMDLQPVPFLGDVGIPSDQNDYFVSFDNGGSRAAVNWQARTLVWDLEQHTVLKDVVLGKEYSLPSTLPTTISRDGRWLAVANGNVAIWDLNMKDARTTARTLDAACSLSDNPHDRECIRRLCEKIPPSIVDKALLNAVQSDDYDELRRNNWKEACAYQ